MAELVEAVLVGAVLAAAAVVDARERIIPNRLVAAIVFVRLARMAIAAVRGGAPGLARQSLGGFLAVVLVLALLFLAGRLVNLEEGIGGGDVKLFCALGVCLGAMRALAVILVACLLGVAFSLVGRHGRNRETTFAFGPPVLAAYLFVMGAAMTFNCYLTCQECEFFR